MLIPSSICMIFVEVRGVQVEGGGGLFNGFRLLLAAGRYFIETLFQYKFLVSIVILIPSSICMTSSCIDQGSRSRGRGGGVGGFYPISDFCFMGTHGYWLPVDTSLNLNLIANINT
jgi:hypothetical protein